MEVRMVFVCESEIWSYDDTFGSDPFEECDDIESVLSRYREMLEVERRIGLRLDSGDTGYFLLIRLTRLICYKKPGENLMEMKIYSLGLPNYCLVIV
jgi:hypothetical protein